ncbi:hypothetical protein [Streptomyces sp. NPDC054783]
MLPKSKVDLYAAIRRDARTGMSMRALMRKYGVGYETAQRALISALPEPRKKMRPRATRLDPYKPVIDAVLKADLTAPRKQRHTVKRIYDRLLDEHDAVGISYQMVRAYVAARREEIRLQAGKDVVDAFVPQTRRPGAEASRPDMGGTGVSRYPQSGNLPALLYLWAGCQRTGRPGHCRVRTMIGLLVIRIHKSGHHSVDRAIPGAGLAGGVLDDASPAPSDVARWARLPGTPRTLSLCHPVCRRPTRSGIGRGLPGPGGAPSWTNDLDQEGPG